MINVEQIAVGFEAVLEKHAPVLIPEGLDGLHPELRLLILLDPLITCLEAQRAKELRENFLGGDAMTNVHFYKREVPIIKRGQATGATELVDFVQLSHPGENLNCIDRRATDEDKKRFHEQFEQYQAGADQIPNGTPISTVFKSPAILRTLERESVFTVEQLAALSGHAIQSIGMGCQEWVNAAKRYIEDCKSVNKADFAATIEALKSEIATLKKAVARLEQ
jgi:hypothetical protein